jgi:hypothetical protein
LAHQFVDPCAFVEGVRRANDSLDHLHCRLTVEDDDIAGLKFRRQLGFHIGLETGPVHRCIDDPGRDHGVAAQAGDEGLGIPAAERGMGAISLSLRCPAGALAQPCVGRGFVDKDEPGQGFVKERLAPSDPMLARLPDLGTPLLAGPEGLFL